ncbi:DNA translocase FtsK [Borrelia miyamotoi]|uniref:DNA translocase FtsK n=1 Tax=Borrelia miyamotoi TaxID=47466 RepID=A0AAP9CFZ3_9SPIR|nr:DNA translocase FtsK [Borrelia miyamotoi]AHH05158.1 Cell division protein ftsK [Borrelia miyamotoi FR64b]ATQ14943.1 DNA translocase FtsK [Borrelia miyamotoi]ATQ16126.1 DNA translocase FtsK [Borrelia miyamotoi]ATQ17271.1 DNA translocase FtsK [Borrelia miyamotoi]ATQ18223.1 DNA translocase FtsK [Borrelia miyamotoi]
MKSFYHYFQFLLFFMLAVILFSIFVALTPVGNIFVFFVFNLIGQMLLNTFSFLSFYLILYPFVNWYVYRKNMFSKRFIFNWNYTVILFFTLTFWLKVNSDLESASNFINWFLSNFGVVLGNFFVFLILILELIVWIYLNYVFFNNASFILDTFHFVVFKFKILFESFFACLPFLSTLKIKKDIKIYKDFDNNLDADKSYNQEDNIINDEEYQALWSFQTFLRKSDKSLNVDLDKTVFYSSEMGEELSEEQSCLEPQCNLNIEGGFNYKSLTEFEDNKLVASGKIKASDIRKQGIISNIVKADYGNLLIDKDSSSYLIDISVFNQRESKSETEDIEYEKEIQKQSMILQETFKEFNINAKLIDVIKGPVVTMYAVCPDKGIKLSKITSISDNIALRLAAVRVRIIAPIPGKEAVGIEIPNKRREFILISEIISSKEFQNDFKVPFALGKEINGNNVVFDLVTAPHLLIAGATGAGKSVCVNSLIASIIFSKSPDDVKLVLIDPKVVELKLFNDIPHLLTPVITDVNRALEALRWCLDEMERRYVILDNLLVRDINAYNKKILEERLNEVPLPYLVIIIDEFADLILSARKDLENLISRLAAMARAVGIHLVLATQRPSVDVITGVIKANFPSRISFMVASSMDSRIILGASGAEKLLGKGDMLYISPTSPFPQRIQGGFLNEKEVYRLVEEVKKFGTPNYIDDEIFIDSVVENNAVILNPSDEPMFEEALEIVRSTQKASASYLQRRLKIGYNRAARIIELMEEMGYIGPINGSKPRDVFI